jgi:hypothetical protein
MSNVYLSGEEEEWISKVACLNSVRRKQLELPYPMFEFSKKA